jgi:hypothetical protein
MVGYGCVGWCWPLEAYVRSTYLGIVKIVYGSIFYFYVVPIHSWHLTRKLNKEDLDLHTLSFSWCLCPGEYGSRLPGTPLPAVTALILVTLPYFSWLGQLRWITFLGDPFMLSRLRYKQKKCFMFYYRNIIYVGIVRFDVYPTNSQSNKQHHHGESFATMAAWLKRIGSPHPRGPLWKGLSEVAVKGF